MKIEYESKIKIYQSSMYTNLNHEIIKENKNKEEKNTKKEDKTIKNHINTNMKMKMKINLLNLEQREIQEKVSIIQSQELKIQEIKDSLNQVRSIYTQTTKSSENKKIKKQIKIRRLPSEYNNLKQKEDQEEEMTKWELVGDKSKIVDLIDITLMKIDKIKLDIERYKSKLISMEQSLKNSKLNLEKQERHITEELVINPIDFVFIQGNISIGIIIDIYI